MNRRDRAKRRALDAWAHRGTFDGYHVAEGIAAYEAELTADLESDEAVKRAFDAYIATPGPLTPYGRLRAALKAALEEGE